MAGAVALVATLLIWVAVATALVNASAPAGVLADLDVTSEPGPGTAVRTTPVSAARAGETLTVSGMSRGQPVLAWPVRGVGSALVRQASALAQGQNPSGVLSQVLTNIRNWLMGLLVGLATLFLTIGGVRYLLAAGDPGEVDAAKRSFKSAAIGYALAALAPTLVEILRSLVGA